MSTAHKLTLTLGLLTCISWIEEAQAVCSCWNMSMQRPRARCGAAFGGPFMPLPQCNQWCKTNAPPGYTWGEVGQFEFDKAKREGCPITYSDKGPQRY